MKIAIVHELYGAGAARCARDLEQRLGVRHEVAFFPRHRGDDADQIFTALRAFGPDVVHCHSFYGDLPYRFLARVSRRYQTCFTVHDPRPIGTMAVPCWECDRNAWCLRCPLVSGRCRKVFANPYLAQRLRRRLVHGLCGRDLRVVAPSEWLCRRLTERELGRFGPRCIPNGIDLERFRPVPGARERLGLPEEMPIVLHIAHPEGPGAMSERKGLRYLAEGFRTHVLPRLPSAILAVAGESVVPNYPWVRPLGLIEQADLPTWLSAVDIYVTATLADNLPYTALEAMGCARPVVGTAVGGIPEVVVHAETGLLVPPRDVAALGEALVTLLSDPPRLRSFGAAGRARAEDRFGMPRFVSAYESLFREMAPRRTPF